MLVNNMFHSNKLNLLTQITTIKKDGSDDLFITCASPEARCLGSINRLHNYVVTTSYIFEYSHEDINRSKNLELMSSTLSRYGKVEIRKADEDDPIPSIQHFLKCIENCLSENPKITLDISTFRRNHLLLILKALDIKGLLVNTRILYTEPEDYGVKLNRPLSFGMKSISVIPTFTGLFDPSKDIQLVLFLGYDGDRALGLLENLDPHDCIVIIAKPAYKAEWEGRSEKLNKAVIEIVGEKNVKYIDSKDPIKVTYQLHKILSEPSNSAEVFNHYIAPLGTKPQTLGIYNYISQFEKEASLIYASPLRHNHEFLSTKIGPTWHLQM